MEPADLIDTVMAEVRRHWAGSQARRLFHGRGHLFPGLEALNVDVYAPIFVIMVYRDGYPVAELAEALRGFALEQGVAPCVLVQRRHVRTDSWSLLYGDLPADPVAREGQWTYGLRFLAQQNVGFFPDMRFGREWVAAEARGAHVLNLFAYTCSFSVVAMAAGAASCVNMDLSKAALSLGRHNHHRNGISTEGVQFLGMDVLKSYGRLERLAPYDVVVIDPPSHQEGFQAEKDYGRIVRRIAPMVAPGGRIMACLNAPHLEPTFLSDLFAAVPFKQIGTSGRPPEYGEAFPERGLKIQLYQKEGGPPETI